MTGRPYRNKSRDSRTGRKRKQRRGEFSRRETVLCKAEGANPRTGR